MNVMCKALTGIALHTFLGMVGYVTKDEGTPHFRLISHNVSQQQLEEGKLEYIKHGKGDLKGKVLLDMRNLFQKAKIFRDKKIANAESEEVPLVTVITKMLQTGVYMPTANWVVPTAGRGMPLWRAKSLWKSMIAPEDVDETDTANIFFEFDSEEPVEKETYGRYFVSKKLRDSTRRTVLKRKSNPLPLDQQHLGQVNGQDFVPFSQDSDSDMGDDLGQRIRDWAPVGTDMWVLDTVRSKNMPQAAGPCDDEIQGVMCTGLLL